MMETPTCLQGERKYLDINLGEPRLSLAKGEIRVRNIYFRH